MKAENDEELAEKFARLVTEEIEARGLMGKLLTTPGLVEEVHSVLVKVAFKMHPPMITDIDLVKMELAGG